ncbi:trypsin-like peptidase domain-containing protein [Synechococcus sp. MU1625]|uniref:trypsin-like peptidase domain-containing protein n=1 Tax=Synechococcus sp. MU1625 TaxID=2508347 RepID=UPI001CF8B86A|nr:trypsin-like peptidase domain-containing protein [Synechococcus sp. MU1625]MCB4400557.1 PDZ domain-containing protein [Synechococcus sp. MU1625]
MTSQSRSLVASALAGGLLLAGVGSIPFIVGPQEAEARPAIRRDSFVTAAVKRSGAAVVTLETARTVNQSGAAGVPPALMRDPLFRHFFGIPRSTAPRSTAPRARVQRGQGSGVIFDAKGLLLTNAHVVEGADQLTVGLSDGRRVPARVVGKDSLTDLAVVRLEGAGPWPVADLGDSDRLSVGDWAIAVGNPFGLESTVTLGIISNLNRNVAQLGISGKRLDLIQTDAAINPGNSGGALLNADGEVIGINTLVRSGPGAGLGFAIPSNRARAIAEQLVTRGKARHPVIGIRLSPVPRPTPTSQVPSGAVIRSVQPGGPADRAGLKVDDVITSFDGKAVADPAAVVSAIDRRGVGATVVLGVRRGEDQVRIEVKPVDLSALPSS